MKNNDINFSEFLEVFEYFCFKDVEPNPLFGTIVELDYNTPKPKLIENESILNSIKTKIRVVE